MTRGHMVRALLLGATLAGGIAAAAPAQAPALKVLGKIEPGRWQLRQLDGGGTRAICLSDPRALLQLRHGRGPQCSRFIVDNQAESGTVHYTCQGTGHGRTTIEVETARLLRVRTQGLSQGLPFEDNIEARRLGGC